MPHGYVLNVWMLLANVREGSFEPIGKRLWLGFELVPSVLKLAVSPIVDVLPVVVDDEASDLDIVLGQLV